MALPPTIPTSFVPRPTSAASQRFRTDIVGAFPLITYGVLVLALVLALAVFAYGELLSSEKVAKAQELAKAEAAIDATTVESFVRLRDRLAVGQTLLDAHIAPSSFFKTLEGLLPTTVRFTALSFTVDQKNVIKLEGSGIAKSFNALAATSAAFSRDGRIKDAIFSNVSVNRDGSVAFSLSAVLDPRIVVFSPFASSGAQETGAAATTTTP